MADPCDADAIVFRWGKDGFEDIAAHFAKHAGHDAMAQEFRVAPGPAFLRSEAGVLVSKWLFHF
jgi:hypothetical protein